MCLIYFGVSTEVGLPSTKFPETRLFWNDCNEPPFVARIPVKLRTMVESPIRAVAPGPFAVIPLAKLPLMTE